ncbi:MAG: ABC transporter permease [Treponema sp.]|jgi:oligopeptide transport system permease protein|nr:ABC transporter permease [Treponema sp.]
MTNKVSPHQTIDPRDFRFISPGEAAVLSGLIQAAGERESYIRGLVKRLRKNKGAMAGFFCIVFIVIMAVAGPFLNGFRYDQQITGNESMAPRIPGLEKLGVFDGGEKLHTSTGLREINRYTQVENGDRYYYWFGSDTLGRDIFTRTWEGTRISLFIALIAVLVDVFIGILYGFSSAYFGGRVDIVMQRIIEVINGIPTLVIVTLLIMVLRPGILSVTLTIMLTGWIGMSRMARAQMLKLKNREYVLAARTLGAGSLRVIFQEIFPNSFGQLLVMSMFSIPNAIFTEAFLAFIGIGIPVPLASLGSLISDSFRSLTSHPYMIVPPVLVLAVLMLSFNLLADGLRDALDPSMKDKS